MSGLSALFEALLAKATEKGAVDNVGKAFLDGAAQRGTFTQGRDFAKTPEGLAAQFGWGAAEPIVGTKADKFLPNPGDPGSGALMMGHSFDDLSRLAAASPHEADGLLPYLDKGDLPRDGTYYTFDTASLPQGSSAGGSAYPALYGNVLADPNAHNIKQSLTGVNAYRNNYALSNAIMRDPDAGSRLLASPEQFQHLPVDVADLRTAGGQNQVGSLQTEGALQTLRRMNTAAGSFGVTPAAAARVQGIASGLSSSMSPSDVQQAVNALRAIDHPAVSAMGPKALKRAGVVNDVLSGRPVDPSVFRGLEYCSGGLVALNGRP